MERIRNININQVEVLSESLAERANFSLPKDVKKAIKKAYQNETNILAKDILNILCDNYEYAEKEKVPICQDTGLAVVFAEVGQDIRIEGGNLTKAINEGIRKAYKNNHLRKSVVSDPLERQNTDTNTPAVIHYKFVPGDKLKMTILPKGCGSENMSRLKMLNPSDGIDGIKSFVIETIRLAGSKPCPPIVVGVGIGGNFEQVALLAKESLLRKLDSKNKNKQLDKLEEELLHEINKLHIGPSGMGGNTTALGVHIKTAPCHIASLPVAVNVQCHAVRHASGIL